MITVSHLRSNEVEVLHVQTQRREKARTEGEALRALVEQFATALAAQNAGGLAFWKLCGRLQIQSNGRPLYVLRFGDKEVAKRVQERAGRGSIQGGGLRFYGTDAPFGLELAGAPPQVVEAVRQVLAGRPGATTELREQLRIES